MGYLTAGKVELHTDKMEKTSFKSPRQGSWPAISTRLKKVHDANDSCKNHLGIRCGFMGDVIKAAKRLTI